MKEKALLKHENSAASVSQDKETEYLFKEIVCYKLHVWRTEDLCTLFDQKTKK